MPIMVLAHSHKPLKNIHGEALITMSSIWGKLSTKKFLKSAKVYITMTSTKCIVPKVVKTKYLGSYCVIAKISFRFSDLHYMGIHYFYLEKRAVQHQCRRRNQGALLGGGGDKWGHAKF